MTLPPCFKARFMWLDGHKDEPGRMARPIDAFWIDPEAYFEARTEAIQRREYWTAEQKRAVDREHARFCKEELREAIKDARAAALLLPWAGYEPLPGDCAMRWFAQWPPELADALNRVWRRAFCTAEGLRQ